MEHTTLPTPEEAFEMYRELVEGNDEAIPILVFGTTEGIVPIGIASVPEGGIQPVLHQVIPMAKQQFGSANWLLFSCESWYRAFKTKEEVTSLGPGALQHMREAGDSEVKECVSITGVSATGEAWCSVTRFERVNGQVVWQDSDTTDAQGGVPDILLHAVR